MATRKEGFGLDVGDLFEPALQKYGIWPITVWPLDCRDKTTQTLKKMIGDVGQERADSFEEGAGEKKGIYGGLSNKQASVFNPATAAHILNMYAPKQGICFDPFAGGGTRAIMAAKHGLIYAGCEIRGEEVDAVYQRCKSNGIIEDQVILWHKDAREACTVWDKYAEGGAPLFTEGADFCYTCPPYWTLEQYDGGTNDLSMMDDYPTFCRALYKVVQETYDILKPGAYSVWVVGLTRKPDGGLVCMHHDVAKMHRKAGFIHREEAILHLKNNGSIQRVGNFERGNRLLIRVHEYVLVFQKPEEK